MTSGGAFVTTIPGSGLKVTIPANASWDGNGYYSNTSGARNGVDSVTGNYGVAPHINVLDVIPTGSPFVRATTPVADLTIDGSNNLKVTSSSYNFVAGDVGATIYITNQTGGWTYGTYTIASVASNAAILTASPGTTGSTSGNWYFNDFRLNNTASAGAACRAAGTPGAIPGIAQVGYPDIGALQSQAPAGGGLLFQRYFGGGLA